jgi:hypothetical protein
VHNIHLCVCARARGVSVCECVLYMYNICIYRYNIICMYIGFASAGAGVTGARCERRSRSVVG